MIINLIYINIILYIYIYTNMIMMWVKQCHFYHPWLPGNGLLMTLFFTHIKGLDRPPRILQDHPEGWAVPVAGGWVKLLKQSSKFLWRIFRVKWCQISGRLVNPNNFWEIGKSQPSFRMFCDLGSAVAIKFAHANIPFPPAFRGLTPRVDGC